MGKPQKRVARVDRTRPPSGSQDGRDFMLVETRNHGSHKNTHRNAARMKFPYGLQSMARKRRPRFQPAGEIGVQRRDREADPRGLNASEIGQNIHIAGDQEILGHDRHRIAKLGQHLQTAPGDLQPAFDWLIAVGYPAHREHLRLP